MNEMFPGCEKMKMLTILEASDYLKVSRQAVYIAIQKKRIKANKVNGKFLISERMLDDYRKTKHDRRISLKLTDKEFTTKDAAKLMGIGKSALYYMIRGGGVKSHRRGFAYIITQKEIDNFLKNKNVTIKLSID